MPTCDECGEEFESERGLHVHEAQVHGSSSSDENSSSGSEGNFSFELKASHAILAAFIVGVFAGGFFMAAVDSFTGPTGEVVAPSEEANQKTSDSASGTDSMIETSLISTEGEPVLGDEDAPVTMVVYEDLQCPACNAFEQQVMDSIKSEYVDTGKVKVVWKDFPLPARIHPWAKDAAVAAECVYREGGNNAFWEVKRKVFANQKDLPKRDIETVQDKIVEWASLVGVDSQSVRSCINGSQAISEVEEDLDTASNYGVEVSTSRGPQPFVSATPSVAIYGEDDDNAHAVVGVKPFSALKDIIDSSLNS